MQQRSAAASINFTTKDNVQIAASLFVPKQVHAPALILVHRLGADRHSWDAFARRMQAEGYMCLSFDMRGHGNSTTRNGEKLDYKNFDAAAWRGVLLDIAAAKHELLKHGVDSDNIFIAGESIGANLALNYMLTDEDIQAGILVSPGLDYKGVTTEKEISVIREKPLLLLVAEGDAYAAASTATLKAAAPGYCELRSWPGTAHGTNLFESSPNAVEQVVEWLKTKVRAH